MATLEDLQAELNALKTEVARLRDEAALFFIVHRDDDGTVTDTQLKCWLLNCEIINVRMRGGNENSVWISAEEKGGCISVFGESGKLRAGLSVNGDSGQLQIYGDDLKAAVRVFEDDGYGHVAVFSPGEVPRGLMKAMEHGGGISALGDDGKPRALLFSNKGKGSVVAANDTHVQAEMGCGDAGGVIHTRTVEDQKGCIMASGPMGNTVIVKTPDGKDGVSLGSTAAGSAVCVGPRGSEDKTQGPVVISDLPNLGGNIVVRDSEGRSAVDISADKDGGCLQVNGVDPAGHVRIDVLEGGGRVVARRVDSPSYAIFNASDSGGLILAGGADDAGAALHVAPTGGTVAVRKGEQVLFYAGPAGDDAQKPVLLLNNAENQPMVQLVSGPEGGAAYIAGADGTIEVAISASDAGGKFTMFSELGVERASVGSANDGGGLHLKWGGTTALVAAATELGGIISAYGADGNIVESMPDQERFTDSEEAED